ncbi:MAG: hypothetical protein R3F46_03935 [bacterium]
MIRSLILTIALLAALSASAFAAHPYEELDPRMDTGYRNYIGDSGWSQGDVQFFSRDERVPYEELSAAERYAVSGAYRADGVMELPWRVRVLMAVDDYYTQYGVVPAVLDDVTLRSISGWGQKSDAEIAWYRSPINGNWPELTNPNQIAGNIYVKPLSTPEKIYLSQFNAGWKRSWFHDLEFSKELYDQGYDYYDCFVKVKPIDSEIWYFRIYGENGVLMAGTNYARPGS